MIERVAGGREDIVVPLFTLSICTVLRLLVVKSQNIFRSGEYNSKHRVEYIGEQDYIDSSLKDGIDWIVNGMGIWRGILVASIIIQSLLLVGGYTRNPHSLLLEGVL